MTKELRAPAALALSITFFSVVSAVGQMNNNKGRSTVDTGDPAARAAEPRRPRSRGVPSNLGPKLPFEPTIIVYYNANKKNAAALADDSLERVQGSSARTENSIQVKRRVFEARAPKVPATAAAAALPRPAESLQPILIYYKTYKSIAPVRSPIQPIVDRNLKIAEPSRGRPGISPNSSNNYSANSRPTQEVQRRTSELKRVGNDAILLRAEAGSDNLHTAGIVPSKETTTKDLAPAITRNSADHQVMEPDIALPRLVVDENAARPAADSKPIGTSSDPEKAPPRQNSENSVTLSDQMKTPASTETAPTDVAAGTSSLRSTSTAAAVLESGSVDAIALNNSAVQLTLESQFAEAQALLQRAIGAQPQVAKFHRNLSIVFEKMKKNDDALASARTADRLSPTDPPVVERLCSLELDMGNSSVARECYERLNSIQPLDSLASTYYGIALFRSGRTDESIRVLEKAANSTPPIPVALNALGIAYFELKRLRQAEQAFKNAVELAPETFHLRYNLAVTQLSLRNKEGALSQYKLLKTGDPKLAAQLYQMLFRDKIVVVPKN